MQDQPPKISNQIAVLIVIALLSAVSFAGYFTFFSPQSKAFIQQCVERKACTADSQCGEGGKCSKKTATTPVGLCICKGARLLWWFDDTASVCQQKQFMGAYMYFGLKTFSTQTECEKALSTKTAVKKDVDTRLNSLDQGLKDVDSSINDQAIDVNAN